MSMGLNTKFKNFPFYYFIYDQAEHFEIEYFDANHRLQKASLKGITFDSFTKNTSENVQALTTDFKNNIGILQFHSFENGYNETKYTFCLFFCHILLVYSTKLWWGIIYLY